MATVADAKMLAHAMIERMNATQASSAVAVLEGILDPFSRALANAPIEDELPSEEEAAAVAASHEWLQTDTALPNRDVLAEFGLTEEDFERMGQTPFCA